MTKGQSKIPIRITPARGILEALKDARHQSRVIHGFIFGRNSTSWGPGSGVEDSDNRHGDLLACQSAAKQLIEDLRVLIEAEEGV